MSVSLSGRVLTGPSGIRNKLPTQTFAMASKKIFDLTPVMAPYFDNHMIIPLLDFVREVHFNLDLHPMRNIRNATHAYNHYILC